MHTLQVARPGRVDWSIRGPVYFSAEGSAAFVLALKSYRENDSFFGPAPGLDLMFVVSYVPAQKR